MDWTVTIGPAKPGDDVVIDELLRASGLPARFVVDHLHDFIVAREGGRLVGCVGLEVYEDTALLRSLAVTSRFRGRGLGRQLTREIVARACRRGVGRIVLLTTTATGFFASAGFVPTPREVLTGPVTESWEFSEGTCATADCLSLEITPGD